MTRLHSSIRWMTPAALLACASIAMAHPGSSMHNLMDGVVHPLTGADHLLAMVAVGVWAALGTGRHVWMVPASFIAMLAVGLIAGRLGSVVPGTETMIAASVVAVGLLMASGIRLQTRWACAAAGLFALFHGLAHGAEIPPAVAAWHFAIGMVVSTALLHAAGIFIGTLVRRTGHETLIPFGGVAVACCGVLIGLGVM